MESKVSPLLYIAGTNRELDVPSSFHLYLDESQTASFPSSFEAGVDKFSHHNRLIVCDLRALFGDIDVAFLKTELTRVKDLLRTTGVALIIPRATDDWHHLSVVMTTIDSVFGNKGGSDSAKICANRQIMLEFSAAIDRRGYTAPNKHAMTDFSCVQAFLLGAVPLGKAEGLLKHVLVQGSKFATSCVLSDLSQIVPSTRLHENESSTRCLMPTQPGALFWEKLIFSEGIKLDDFLEKSSFGAVILDFSPGLGCLAVAAASHDVPYVGKWNNVAEYRGNEWQRFAAATYGRMVSYTCIYIIYKKEILLFICT